MIAVCPAGSTCVRPPRYRAAAALEFRQFARSGAFEKGVIRAGPPAHLLVDHGLRVFAVDDGAQRHFRRARRTDLAHKNEVERGLQGAGDLEGHRYATTRQGIDDRPIQRHAANLAAN